jgi:hypothetical protein
MGTLGGGLGDRKTVLANWSCGAALRYQVVAAFRTPAIVDREDAACGKASSYERPMVNSSLPHPIEE